MNEAPKFGSNVGEGGVPELPEAPDWSNVAEPGEPEGNSTQEGAIEFNGASRTFGEARALLTDLETADNTTAWAEADELRKAMEAQWPDAKF